ncbi:MAG TPA: ice-binding family protein [Solirubrobacteraceae bacterium]|nr:ice-binding family protein [Solirubrobacteraceae bacterium]
MSTSGRRDQRLQAPADRARRSPACARAGAGLASILVASLAFAGAAQAAAAPVTLGTDANFSVLAGQTITNTGLTTMARDLGLDPGTSVTGAPTTLGTMHIDDAVAIQAKSDLVTAINDAAGRPATPLTSADLSGRAFTPGVYSASSSLLFSAGSVTLNAQGDPNAVFIFQVGSSLTTGSATSVLLTNGAQPCNVFWEIGASATLGSGSTFAGTVLAQTSITAGTSATLNGRLLASTGSLTLDNNTITTSACATPAAGSGGTTTGGTPTSGGTPSAGGTPTTSGTPTPLGTTPTPVGSTNTANKNKLAAQRRARHQAAVRKAKRIHRLRAQRRARQRRLARHRLAVARARQLHSPARVPISSGGFTG